MPRRFEENMMILYIGESKTRDLYVKGINPSNWLYGAIEMAKDGNEVFWEDERHSILNDLRLLRKHKPEMVFIPNLNLTNHLLLLFLSAFGVMRIPIYAYLHHEPKVKNGVVAMVYKLLLSAPRHLFFLSSKTMEESVKAGLVKRGKCSVPMWGPDMEFYNKVEKSDQGYFVSTGKENRDYDILVEAFKQTGIPLKIMTAKSHAGSNYEYLVEKCKDIPNIEVVLTENTGSVYPQMLKAMANAKAIVCPLRRERLDYCVGLSTIADAIGLKKPLIITRNPYHDTEYVKDAMQVETLEEWVEAIKMVMERDSKQVSSDVIMENCYRNMKIHNIL